MENNVTYKRKEDLFIQKFMYGIIVYLVIITGFLFYLKSEVEVVKTEQLNFYALYKKNVDELHSQHKSISDIKSDIKELNSSMDVNYKRLDSKIDTVVNAILRNNGHL